MMLMFLGNTLPLFKQDCSEHLLSAKGLPHVLSTDLHMNSEGDFVCLTSYEKARKGDLAQDHMAKGWQSWNGACPELSSATMLALQK